MSFKIMHERAHDNHNAEPNTELPKDPKKEPMSTKHEKNPKSNTETQIMKINYTPHEHSCGIKILYKTRRKLCTHINIRE